MNRQYWKLFNFVCIDFSNFPEAADNHRNGDNNCD